MKKRQGFTLIELLAVIVILAIIALIATPIILNIVEKARKSAFQDSAYGIIEAAKLQYVEGILDGSNSAATYTFDGTNNSGLQFSGSAPEGGTVVVDSEGNVGIAIYNNGMCALKGTKESTVRLIEYDASTCVVPDAEDDPIITLVGDREIKLYFGDTYTEEEVIAKTRSGRELTYTKTITKDGVTVGSIDTSTEGEYTITYTTEVSNGKKATVTRIVKVKKEYVCRRATTLHTEECTQTSNYCYAAGYTTSGTKGTTTITYGNLGTGTTLASGDAFDCDVNGDGTFNAETERFYYVSDLYNTTTKTFDNSYGILVYYNNTTAGVADNTSASLIAYHALANENCQGPVTAKANLPTTSQWSNVSLSSTTRAILTETGIASTASGTLPTAFSYAGYAARLLTAQEVNSACGITVGSLTTGELDTCNYLMENTRYSASSLGTAGYWLETPRSSSSERAWLVKGIERYVYYYYTNTNGIYGSRPAIEVPKTDIEM